MEDRNGELSKLINKLVGGDMNALGDIYEMLARGLKFFAMSFLHNKHDAEDAVHDFMIALVKKAKKLKNNKNVCGWINVIFENMVLDRLRKRKQHMEIALDCAVTKGIEINYKYLCVKEALEKLSKSDRHLVYYQYWHNLSIAEIASIYKIPKSTLQYRLDKIKEQLKNILKD